MVPSGRPKGKDFAAMAAKSSAPQSSPPPPVPAPGSAPIPVISSSLSGYNKTTVPAALPVQVALPLPPRQPHLPYKQREPLRTSYLPQTPPPTSLESQVNGPLTAPITGPKLASILQSIDPHYTLDDEVQHQILHLLNDFLEATTLQALKLSSHRGSNVLDVKDVQLVLKKMWGMNVPGFGMADADENLNRADKRMRTDL